MFEAIDLLPDASTPVTLFTRHSLRELVDGQGLAGYDLQLTPQGRELAQAWGNYLIKIQIVLFSIVFQVQYNAVLIRRHS